MTNFTNCKNLFKYDIEDPNKYFLVVLFDDGTYQETFTNFKTAVEVYDQFCKSYRLIII